MWSIDAGKHTLTTVRQTVRDSETLYGEGDRVIEVAVLHLKKECTSCGTEFSFLTARHRCKQCSARPTACPCLFWARPPPSRPVVSCAAGHTKPVRVCVECHIALTDGVNASVSSSVEQSRGASRSVARSVESSVVRATTRLGSACLQLTASGELMFAVDDAAPPTLSDFAMQGVIGKGGFGKVLKVVNRRTGGVFALKTLQKQKLIKMKQVEHAMEEKKIMSRVRHPFVINMWYAFQTPSKVYMVLDYAPGGDLFYLLQRQSKCRFIEAEARFAAAEVTLALEHLHGLGIVHRDLKPENILIDLDGHLRLADFGLSRADVHDDARHSMVGTPDYMAPEILLNSGHGCAVDWWSLGILIYEMLMGEPPFMGSNARHTYENIRSAKTPFFPSWMNVEAKGIIERLLQRNPAMRPGTGHRGANEVRMHPFFRSVHWDNLLAKRLPSPFLRHVSADALEGDVSSHKPNMDSVCAPPQQSSTEEKTWEEYDWIA